MSAHLPGPWIITVDPDGMPGDCCIGAADSKIDEVAVCSKRDASLIAAAPDMYEALKAIVYWHEMAGHVDESWFDAARAALAKAGGQ